MLTWGLACTARGVHGPECRGRASRRLGWNPEGEQGTKSLACAVPATRRANVWGAAVLCIYFVASDHGHSPGTAPVFPHTPENVRVRALFLQCALCTVVHCIFMLSPPDLWSQHLAGYRVGYFTYLGRHSATQQVPRFFVGFVPCPSLMNALGRALVCFSVHAFRVFAASTAPTHRALPSHPIRDKTALILAPRTLPGYGIQQRGKGPRLQPCKTQTAPRDEPCRRWQACSREVVSRLRCNACC